MRDRVHQICASLKSTQDFLSFSVIVIRIQHLYDELMSNENLLKEQKEHLMCVHPNFFLYHSMSNNKSQIII